MVMVDGWKTCGGLCERKVVDGWWKLMERWWMGEKGMMEKRVMGGRCGVHGGRRRHTTLYETEGSVLCSMCSKRLSHSLGITPLWS